ncbi:MAG: 50S ribosomal protein L29 [Cyanobacteriota bacterium]
MDMNELRDLTIDELNDKVKECRAKLFDIRFKLATHKVENTAEIAALRHTIAQAKTVIRQKELAEELASVNK